ncbi:MAG: guanylate kinase [Planctomycetota bacterium]
MEETPTADGRPPAAGGSPPPGELVIVSGPSGVGKSTIMPLVRQRFGQRLRMSISATTRPPRPGELNGENYHFLSDEDFQQRLSAGEFIESVEVFGRGHWYGTLLSEVLPSLETGIWVILEIDVDGAGRALERFPDAVTIFISSAEDPDEAVRVLEQRLRTRGTESEEALRRRLEVARREIELSAGYQHIVINDSVDRSVDAICQILKRRGIDG